MPKRPHTKLDLSDEDLRRLQNRRREDLQICLDEIVDAAIAYHEETMRTDQFHGARMSQRKSAMWTAIDHFNEARRAISEMSDKEIEFDLDFMKRLDGSADEPRQ